MVAVHSIVPHDSGIHLALHWCTGIYRHSSFGSYNVDPYRIALVLPRRTHKDILPHNCKSRSNSQTCVFIHLHITLGFVFSISGSCASLLLQVLSN